jgi:hypothetical protein
MVPSFRWMVEGFKEELIGYIPTKEGLFSLAVLGH